jgi:hypothetical protein
MTEKESEKLKKKTVSFAKGGKPFSIHVIIIDNFDLC